MRVLATFTVIWLPTPKINSLTICYTSRKKFSYSCTSMQQLSLREKSFLEIKHVFSILGYSFKGQNQSACFCFVHYLTISYDTKASLTHVNYDRLTSRSQSGRRLSLHVDSDLPPTSIHILTGIRRRNRHFVGRIVEREGFYDCVAVGVKQGHSVSGERPRGCSNRGVPSYGQLTQTKKKHL